MRELSGSSMALDIRRLPPELDCCLCRARLAGSAVLLGCLCVDGGIFDVIVFARYCEGEENVNPNPGGFFGDAFVTLRF